VTRIRVRFSKVGKVRWTSHRDLARMWERAFRRTNLPLAYSVGFSPRPKVSFGLALPTGVESVAEYLDFELADTEAGLAVLDQLATLPARLSAALPVGVDAVAVEAIGPGTSSLQEAVASCTWQWTAVAVDGNPISEQELTDRVAALLASPSLTVTRPRKGAQVTDDIRDSVLDLGVIGPAGPGPLDGIRLQADLSAQPRSLRPSEVTAGLGDDLESRDTRRLYQWISRDGARWEPLAGPPATTDAPHALGRAS
jgi:radical SAM-linked protein